MNARFIFNASAIVEVSTGIALLVVPALVIRLMLGSELDQTSLAIARIAGAALLSLGLSTRETPQYVARFTTRAGMCIFNLLAAGFLANFAIVDGLAGVLLWPIAIFHGVIGAAMAWFILNSSKTR